MILNKSQNMLLLRPFLRLHTQDIVPMDFSEPLALEYLASVIRERHEVSIYDCIAEGYKKITLNKDWIDFGADVKSIKKVIEEKMPDAVGITVLCNSQAQVTFEVTKAIKAVDNNILTILGGAYASSYQEKALEYDQNLDIIVYGEGELTFKQLCDNGFKNLKEVNGIIYKKNNKIIKNPPRERIKNLDTIPFPSRDLVPFKIYSRVFGPRKKFIHKVIDKLIKISSIEKWYLKIRSRPKAWILTSRGCPNKCTFCSIYNVWGHKYKMRSAKNVLDELEWLVNQYDVRHVAFVDDNFTVSKKRAIDICKGIRERKLDLSIEVPSGVYIPPIDKELLIELKNTGLSQLTLPIESGNQKVLDNVITKKIKLSQVKNVIKLCKEVGIHTQGFFILGLPGETKETMHDTIRFASTSGLDLARFYIYMPIHGSKLYDYALEKGYISDNFSLDKLRIDTDFPSIRTEEFSQEDVLEIKEMGEKLMKLFSYKVIRAGNII